MFTLTQIKEAHAKVKSGTDFPQYTKELLSLGVLRYTIYVRDGHAEYIGKEDYSIVSNAGYTDLHISPEADSDNFKYHLKAHQQGKTDYLTFCRDSAETGIDKWTVDILAKTCTYYDKSGNSVLEEKIPI
ncbi:DUF1398 domain-containing protein [Dysgonomonas termitidis]|uniref:DUF1398 domain-containing protein n=1 Tax=Dysgonomonas termitidis TaxID=1516126 RepID=A0ABV9KRY9_9BACT